MATIRMPESIWTQVHQHLFSRPSEHFAFLLARHTTSPDGPVFLVQAAHLVPDEQVTVTRSGWNLSPQAIVDAINAAVRTNTALIEVHNHGGVRPRFSMTDREGFAEFPPYALESLPGHPYAATVWGDSTVYGEYFLPNGKNGVISSITVLGRQLRQLVSRDDDGAALSSAFDRQLPWFTRDGQHQIGRLQVGIVGLGGTGAQVAQNLAYLGTRDFVLADNDAADETNMNRLVTATAADLETNKTTLARRLIRSVAPGARVTVVGNLRSSEALAALKGVDVLFGCVDNDGARLIMNEFAVAYAVPYLDLGVGIDAEGGVVQEAGGRLAVVLPGGPCLNCMNEIDPAEAAFFLASPEEQRVQIERGYVRGMNAPAPSVISLNGTLAGIAVTELAILVSGIRPISAFTELDALGSGRALPSQWLTPRVVQRASGCITCAMASRGDVISLERYQSQEEGGDRDG